jgi:hypothetical protein
MVLAGTPLHKDEKCRGDRRHTDTICGGYINEQPYSLPLRSLMSNPTHSLRLRRQQMRPSPDRDASDVDP